MRWQHTYRERETQQHHHKIPCKLAFVPFYALLIQSAIYVCVCVQCLYEQSSRMKRKDINEMRVSVRENINWHEIGWKKLNYMLLLYILYIFMNENLHNNTHILLDKMGKKGFRAATWSPINTYFNIQQHVWQCTVVMFNKIPQ